VCFFANGDRYDGDWAGGRRHGTGTLVSADGAAYVGQWADDARHGVGVLTLPSGDSYEGGWVADQKHGPGRFVFLARRQVYEGEWVGGVAKAGVLSALALEGEGDADGAPVLDEGLTRRHAPLPSLALADADAVVEEAVAAARDGSGASEPAWGEASAPWAAATAAGAAAGAGAEAGVGAAGGGRGAGAGAGAGGTWALPPGVDLTDAEADELHTAFSAGAPGADGTIAADALGAVLDALGLDPRPEEVAQLLAEMKGALVAGRVPFGAFAACMAAHRSDA
jgi:hypothetical protein